MGLRTLEVMSQGDVRGGQVGTKRWWSFVKEQQGELQHSPIPSFQWDNGEMAHSALDKANLLANHFAKKMCIPDPERTPPTLSDLVRDKLVLVKTSEKYSLESECEKKQWDQTTSTLAYFILVLMSWRTLSPHSLTTGFGQARGQRIGRQVMWSPCTRRVGKVK